MPDIGPTCNTAALLDVEVNRLSDALRVVGSQVQRFPVLLAEKKSSGSHERVICEDTN